CSSIFTDCPTKACANAGSMIHTSSTSPERSSCSTSFRTSCSDLSHWRKRLGGKLELLLAEELAGGARERGAADEGFGAGHGRYHRAAQGHHLPNRCEAFARRDQGANPTGQEARRAAAAIVCAHRQARRPDGRALCPCQTVQPPPSTAAHFAHPPRQAHSRHPAQDRRQRGTRGGIRLATLTCRSDPLAAAAPARLEAVFLPRSGGGVASAGARPARLTNSVLKLPSSPPMPGHRVANLFCTPGRCPAILMTATRWAPSSKPLRGSPAVRSSVPMSTRDTAATMPQTRAASSSQAKNAGSSAAS